MHQATANAATDSPHEVRAWPKLGAVPDPKANRLLGYQPQVRIREGLRQTLAWFKANQTFIQERN